MHPLTPHQLNLLHALKTGPWPVGLAEIADSEFQDLLTRKLAVVRSTMHGARGELTEAGWAKLSALKVAS